MFRILYIMLIAVTGQLVGENVHKQLIDNYSSNYCLSLEEAYGGGMMSEGGAQAIDDMFQGIVLQDKKILDIGSGLGGLPLYVAKRYMAHVTGIEINPWMVEESRRRIPPELTSSVDFVLIHEDQLLPFADASFDIVCSKGVLTHVEDKGVLFKEVFRVLKPGGLFIIDDWLSPSRGKWGEKLTKMAETEGLILFAETEMGYCELLKNAGFQEIEIRSESAAYALYNRDIAKRLASSEMSQNFEAKFGKQALLDSIAGYEMIAESIEANELLIRHFQAKKLQTKFLHE